MNNLDVDGDMTLQDQERDLNFGQNTLTAELINYASASGGSPPNQFQHTNVASFQSVGIGAVPRPIRLLPSGLAPPPGLSKAFDATIFVVGQTATVSVYH